MSDKLYHECHELIRQSKAVFEDLHYWGVDVIPINEDDENSTTISSRTAGKSEPRTLQELEASLEGCTLCPLCRERKSVVFGRGNPHAELVLVGEAPGREEDEKGYPFVGEAGRLLEKILFAMQLKADDVYICNVIKCRPPRNRDPETEEIALCEPFLQQQLALIKPRIIVTLGRFAAQTLLQSKAPISRIRGHWHQYQGIALMPTFHPAYLLRNPAGKREVWNDMKLVMNRLNG